METKFKNQSDSAVSVKKHKISFIAFVLKYNAPFLLILLIVISSFLSPFFLTRQNIFNVLRQQVVYILISMGVMTAILTGGLDLSTTSVATVGSMMAAMCITNWNWNNGIGLACAIFVAAGSGFLIGLVNGWLIAYLKMAPFVVTLAMSTIGQGLAFTLTNGAPIRLLINENPAAAMLVGFGQATDPWIGVPLPAYFAFTVAGIFYVVMKYTSFGRLLIATGSNANAVRLSGINERKYKFWAHVLCSTLAALAGIMVTARGAIGTPQTAASDYSLMAVAACFIGGCSINGGRGTVSFVLIGVFIIALITNIMNLLSVAPYPQLIIKGVIMIVSVLLRSIEDHILAR